MDKLIRLSLIGFVFCLLGVAMGGSALAQVVNPGYDLLETDSSATLDDMQFGNNYFGPGSLPFETRINLKGVPFATFDPDGPGPMPTFTDLLPTDTIVRRTAAAGPVYPATVPIQIVQLQLVSVQPFTVKFAAGPDQTWSVSATVSVDPTTGLVDPPQVNGSMTIRHDPVGSGGTFDSTLPVRPYLTFTRVDAPGSLPTSVSPIPIIFTSTGEPWSHVASPLISPADGEAANVVAGLTSNFFPGCVCANCPPPVQSAVCYSVDGGVFNPLRNGAPLTPLPNPAEGLFQPDPRNPVPDDVYALGTAPGGNNYATEGEIFQSAGAPLGASPNVTNVDRISAAVGVGPIPFPPPYLGPFAPNPGAPAPAPLPPGIMGSLGLTPNDNIDALSFGKDSGNVLFFSVSPTSVGIGGSAVRTHAVLSPFAGAAAPPLPFNPGGGDPGREAAGDIYKTVTFAPFGSYIPLHLATGKFITPAVAANDLVYDERLLGLQAPARNGTAIAAPEDDLDAVEMSDAGDPIWGVDLVNNTTLVGPPDGIPDRPVFFSVDTASPANSLPGFDPDDILVTPPGGFVFNVYADGQTTMGLMPGDDIDGLALSDVAISGVLDPGMDEALFTLHPGSPSVRFGPDGIPGTGDEVSAADIFYTRFTGTHALYAPAAALGLLRTDNVDALDIWPREPLPPGGGGGGGGVKKKLSVEDESRAKHGIKVSEKRRCDMTKTTAVFQVTIFNPFMTFTVNPVGPSRGMRGATEFNPNTGQTHIPIELLSMSLSSNATPLGPMTIRAGRELGFEPSLGEIDPHSLSNDYPALAFFDVFVHVQASSQTWHTDRPFHVQAEVQDFPPYGSPFQGNQPVQLLDQNNIVVGVIQTAVHTPLCQVPSDCDDLNPCTTDSCEPLSGVCQHVAIPDADGDGICDPQDNCPAVPNAGQAVSVFPLLPEMINFPAKNNFCWTTQAPVHVVFGPLAGLSTYQVTQQFHDPSTICHPAPQVPPPGSGLYYLIELDCPSAASFQSSLGMEPARDTILP